MPPRRGCWAEGGSSWSQWRQGWRGTETESGSSGSGWWGAEPLSSSGSGWWEAEPPPQWQERHGGGSVAGRGGSAPVRPPRHPPAERFHGGRERLHVFGTWPCTMAQYPLPGEPGSWKELSKNVLDRLGTHVKLGGRQQRERRKQRPVGRIYILADMPGRAWEAYVWLIHQSKRVVSANIRQGFLKLAPIVERRVVEIGDEEAPPPPPESFYEEYERPPAPPPTEPPPDWEWRGAEAAPPPSTAAAAAEPPPPPPAPAAAATKPPPPAAAAARPPPPAPPAPATAEPPPPAPPAAEPEPPPPAPPTAEPPPPAEAVPPGGAATARSAAAAAEPPPPPAEAVPPGGAVLLSPFELAAQEDLPPESPRSLSTLSTCSAEEHEVEEEEEEVEEEPAPRAPPSDVAAAEAESRALALLFAEAQKHIGRLSVRAQETLAILRRELPRMSAQNELRRTTNTSRCVLYFCTACFRRGWQLRFVLALNALCMWAWRGCVRWLIAFCGEDEVDTADAQWAAGWAQQLPDLLHIRWPARGHGLDGWSASKGKNAAHRAAIELAPARGETEEGTDVLLLNLDADNYLTAEFCGGLSTVVAGMRPATDALQFAGTDAGTTGRIGVFAGLFACMGGYDESLLPSGFQDIDVLRRVQAKGKGRVFRTYSDKAGASVPNDMWSSKRKPAFKVKEVAPAFAKMTWNDMNQRNHAAATAALTAGRWYRNYEDLEVKPTWPAPLTSDAALVALHADTLCAHIGLAVEAVPPASSSSGATAAGAAAAAAQRRRPTPSPVNPKRVRPVLKPPPLPAKPPPPKPPPPKLPMTSKAKAKAVPQPPATQRQPLRLLTTGTQQLQHSVVAQSSLDARAASRELASQGSARGRGGGRGAAVDENLFAQSLAPLLEPAHVHVCPIDCRGFADARVDDRYHLGFAEDKLREFVRSREFATWLARTRIAIGTARRQGHARGAQQVATVCYCRPGCPPSVSASQVLSHVLFRDPTFQLVAATHHLSRPLWEMHYCNECRNCRALSHGKAAAFEEAWQAWARLL